MGSWDPHSSHDSSQILSYELQRSNENAVQWKCEITIKIEMSECYGPKKKD